MATLATLILLSYAKLLEICFKSLSVGILEYPDKHSREMLWLPDTTVRYLSGKHIPLFIVAVLILLVGLIYTALLFSWQWLLYLPMWIIFRWTRNPKIQTFIETYHTPRVLSTGGGGGGGGGGGKGGKRLPQTSQLPPKMIVNSSMLIQSCCNLGTLILRLF